MQGMKRAPMRVQLGFRHQALADRGRSRTFGPFGNDAEQDVAESLAPTTLTHSAQPAPTVRLVRHGIRRRRPLTCPVSEPLATSLKGRRRSTPDGPSFLFKAGSRFRHFPQLDGLRGSAVLIVVVGHTLVFRLGFGYRWTHFALLGVLIFFVLSGFLITGLLCSEERRFRKISLKDFYLRRALRILPAFSAFILVVCLLIRLDLVTDTPWATVGVSVVFLKNILGTGTTLAHLWSLSIEEQFYLVWPIIFSVVGRRRLLAPTLGLILGIVVYRTAAVNIAPYLHGRGIFELRSDFRMDSILVGCALALFLDGRSEQPNQFAPLVRWLTHPIWVVPALLFWTLYCDIPPLWSVYLTIQTVLVCILVFNAIAFPNSVLGYALQLRSICFVGLISYSLYLWQQVFLVTNVPDWGLVRDFPFCLFASGAAAVLSYFVIERPFLRLKRRFSGTG
jgi:peptidoglycan/LPS O-acetylase OafA/YrhL